jgi:diguanylate cyclase (GGDEF)-like protein
MPLPADIDDKPERPRASLSRGWNLAFNLITVGFCAICVLLSLDVRRSAWEQARLSAGNLVSAIQTDIERNIELYDLSLQAVVDGLREPDIGAVRPEIRQLVLFDRAATAKYMGSILVLNRNGDVVLDSRSLSPAPENDADHDFFTAHKRDPGLGLYIGKLELDRSGQHVIGISRRLAASDGSFAGVVVGTLRIAYFDALFKKLNLGQDSTITLVRSDGTTLARLPSPAPSIGRNLAGADLFRHFNAGAPSGSFESMAASDGVNRLFTYGQIGPLPLILTVGLSTRQIDAAWLRSSGILGLVVMVLVAGVVMLKRRLGRELARRLAAEEDLSVQARTDSLTGLPNRRHFDEALEREWRRALRAGSWLGLLMIDVDHFKSFNDQFGHHAGDQILAAIAGCIANTAQRATDFAARYGGEEFAVLLSGKEAQDAIRLAERICAAVATMERSPGVPSGLTVSVGVACLAPDAHAIQQDLVGTADRALFDAKQGGRNRVVSADPPAGGAQPRLVA